MRAQAREADSAAPKDSGDSSAPADGNGAPLEKAEELTAVSDAHMAPSEGGEARGVRPPAAEPPSVGPLMSATAAGRDSRADEGGETLDEAAEESRECEFEYAYSHHTLGTQSCGAADSTLADEASEAAEQGYHHAVLAEARRLGRVDKVSELLVQHRRAMREEAYERVVAINALIRDALTHKPQRNRRKRRS